MQSFTDVLFARPSFLEGIARLFDFGGGLNEYNSTSSPEQSDAIAMRADWETIGADMRRAIVAVAGELPDTDPR
jgi:hypothetical protein